MTGNRFVHYWPFVRGNHQRPVDPLYKWLVMENFKNILCYWSEQDAKQTADLSVT